MAFNTNGLGHLSGRVDLIKYYYPQVTCFMLVDSLISGQKGAFMDAVRHLILPTIVLGTIPLAIIARMTRSSMLEVLENLADVRKHPALLARKARGQQLAVAIDEAPQHGVVRWDLHRLER